MKEVRKKRKKNILRLQVIGLVASGIVVLAILLFLFLFRITTVTVEGNIHYTEDEINQILAY